MRGRRLILTLVLLTTASCKGPGPSPVPQGGEAEVRGRVEDSWGRPVAHGAVRLYPLDEKNKGRTVICLTKSDGTFTGHCVPGRYKVTLWAARAPTPSKAAQREKGKPAPPKPTMPAGVPERYGSFEETPWEVDVPAEGKSAVVLKVEGR
jgi:hypothetical protein